MFGGLHWHFTLLSVALFYGVGVAVDLRSAVSWYRRSAEVGYAYAQYSLGCCYADGVGVAADVHAAAEWLERAAAAGRASVDMKARAKLAELLARDPP